jgi:trk system potassium uptake protein TrkA
LRRSPVEAAATIHRHEIVMKRFVIVGLGNFGSSVAEALYAKGHEVIAIDPIEKAVDSIAQYVSRAAVGDGRDLQVLKRVGAENADAGVVSTGDDITASILATMALHDLGVRDVYVKVISRDHARVMERMGVTESVFPERESALALGARMSGAGLLNYVRLGPGFSIQEMAVPQSWNGSTLRDLDLRRRFAISVVAIHDVLTDKINPAPDPDAILKESDTILVAGRDEDLARAADVE